MARKVVDFEVQGIAQANAIDLKTRDVVQISLQPQGRLQVLVSSRG